MKALVVGQHNPVHQNGEGEVETIVERPARFGGQSHLGPWRTTDYTSGMDAPAQDQWMRQWRAAACALEQVRREELAAMTDEDAAKAACAVMELSGGQAASPPHRAGERDSGRRSRS
jgi:hypothetical protein